MVAARAQEETRAGARARGARVANYLVERLLISRSRCCERVERRNTQKKKRKKRKKKGKEENAACRVRS